MKFYTHFLMTAAGSALLAGTAFAQGQPAADPALTAAIAGLQSGWDQAQYQLTDKAAQREAFAALETKGDAAVVAYPQNADVRIWDGIIYSSDAGVTGGMGALPKVKKAKELFEQAIAINPQAMNGGGHTSLGSLYYKVPGWPIAFGDKDEAKKQLEAALAISPADIDANYFYGDYLVDQKQYDKAIPALQKAMQAPARPGRELADAGRRKEIQADLVIAQREQNSAPNNNRR